MKEEEEGWKVKSTLFFGERLYQKQFRREGLIQEGDMEGRGRPVSV